MQHLPLLPTKATLCAAVLLFCFSTKLWSQRPTGPSSKAHICGVPAKLAEAPAGTPSEDIIFDRFGGTYSMAEMEQNAIFFMPLDCESSSDFILELDDRNGAFTEAESNVICEVFTYLSGIVHATSGEKAVIRLVKEPSLPANSVATASPLFPNRCGLGHSLVHRQLITGGQPHMEHGFIRINPAINFHYAENSGSTNIQTDEIDFYSVILHEALHLLGFASQISTTGEPTQDFYTQ